MQATAKRVRPVAPPVEQITLTLSLDEARRLMGATGGLNSVMVTNAAWESHQPVLRRYGFTSANDLNTFMSRVYSTLSLVGVR